MEDANGEGLYLTKIPVSTHVSLYHHLHMCIPYYAFYQLMTACACVRAKQLIGTWPILQLYTDATSIVQVSLIMITCVYLLHVISAVIVLALHCSFTLCSHSSLSVPDIFYTSGQSIRDVIEGIKSRQMINHNWKWLQ